MTRSRWILASVLLAASAAAQAATLTVTEPGDAGNGVCATECTLRDAIASAAPGDTIVFGSTFAYPTAKITLNGQELLVYKNLTVLGPGADLLSISANNRSRIFEIAANASVSLSGLGLVNGSVAGANSYFPATNPDGGPAYGGAILVNAGSTLQLAGCRLSANTAYGGSAQFNNSGTGGTAYGGAIYSAGSLLIADTTFSGNTSSGGAGGQSSSLTPAGNGGNAYGGAIYATDLTEIGNSQFLLNVAQGAQGGANSAEFGASGNGGSAYGGAIATSGFTALSFASAVGNSASEGSSGYPSGGSNGQAAGADIYSSAAVLSRYVALTSTGRATSCNPSGGPCPIATSCSIAATSSTQGANLDADSSCSGFNLHGNAKLQILTSGGRTFAYPLWGSPLIDAAADCKDAFGTTITTDVRGEIRPLDGKADGIAACDLGAVESDELFANGFE